MAKEKEYTGLLFVILLVPGYVRDFALLFAFMWHDVLWGFPLLFFFFVTVGFTVTTLSNVDIFKNHEYSTLWNIMQGLVAAYLGFRQDHLIGKQPHKLQLKSEADWSRGAFAVKGTSGLGRQSAPWRVPTQPIKELWGFFFWISEAHMHITVLLA